MDLREIMNNQPTINIGMIGSVSNGKSSITEKLTGIKTQKHSNETKRNITIKLGYANAKIFKCKHCPPPKCYQSHSSATQTAQCNNCDSGDDMELMKHISFVDIPGHVYLMTTMLNGATVMDTTITVESASNTELSDQTKQHLTATRLADLPNSITCLNKMDLIKKNIAVDRLNKLQTQLIGTQAENSPIVPVVANYGTNVDVLCEYICRFVKEPKRDLESKLKMTVVRSFNINKQQVPIDQLEGGVVGGSIIKGVLKMSDKIIIYPGLCEKNTDKTSKNLWKYKPLRANVLSINSETNDLQLAIPGGLIGVKLDIDPSLTTKDGLIGNIITNSDNEFHVYEVVFVELNLINDSQQINNKDMLLINCNACNVEATVVKTVKDKAEIRLLEKPICCNVGEYITLSRIMNNKMIQIIGRAKILDGLMAIKM